ncbi:Na(+)-translocating NADH-quinone reductase subunit A [Cesiribacter andamanensis]|uniref:Na(+)-translocating NADH-quinone reductase subunit A n=1 Tax=Cesiribacter andamanensis AMV16 TaxID=1279009 RepID=M7N386_9BACT|nr:Na(+)-translocating NADH-quinone reductase subunit A [Cesiribacter andamanensis]EMR01686.1 Na(+)-translocating NADH-quinone reductase subunit A [Cesiribacter andamanensis AMV16]
MSKVIKLKKGFNINLAGQAERKVAGEVMPETFALKPTDFWGIQRPKVLVKEGDTVKAGTPILFDKANPKVQFVAPVSGEVVEVVRGAKRKLLEIRILADKQLVYEEFPKLSASELSALPREEAVELLARSGVWPHLVQRPYGIIASPDVTPRAIFISTFDTHPLAPEYDFLLKGQERYFQAGIDMLKRLTDGPVHLGIHADAELSPVFADVKGATLHKFSGKHPAGNVGVQIHHIDPINKGDIVWTINPVGVVQIGKLLVDGRYDSSKLVALTGSELTTPQYIKTWSGAQVGKLIGNGVKAGELRYISGNVLTGTNVGREGYLGFHDNMVTVIPEGKYYDFLGWLKPTADKLSFHRSFGLLSFLRPNKPFVVDTNLQGEERAFVQTSSYGKVVPMDIMPEYLVKAIMAEDYDGMEALGIYEVIEEDLALCEFIDVSKHDFQAILREGLTLMQYS